MVLFPETKPKKFSAFELESKANLIDIQRFGQLKGSIRNCFGNNRRPGNFAAASVQNSYLYGSIVPRTSLTFSVCSMIRSSSKRKRRLLVECQRYWILHPTVFLQGRDNLTYRPVDLADRLGI